jgi:hypothetical protein
VHIGWTFKVVLHTKNVYGRMMIKKFKITEPKEGELQPSDAKWLIEEYKNYLSNKNPGFPTMLMNFATSILAHASMSFELKKALLKNGITEIEIEV